MKSADVLEIVERCVAQAFPGAASVQVYAELGAHFAIDLGVGTPTWGLSVDAGSGVVLARYVAGLAGETPPLARWVSTGERAHELLLGHEGVAWRVGRDDWEWSSSFPDERVIASSLRSEAVQEWQAFRALFVGQLLSAPAEWLSLLETVAKRADYGAMLRSPVEHPIHSTKIANATYALYSPSETAQFLQALLAFGSIVRDLVGDAISPAQSDRLKELAREARPAAGYGGAASRAPAWRPVRPHVPSDG